MFCVNCGTQNHDDAAYCKKCGHKLKARPSNDVLYQSQGRPSSWTRSAAIGIILSVAMCIGLVALSFLQVDRDYVRRPTAEEKESADLRDGAVLGGVIDTYKVDVFEGEERAFIWICGATVLVLGIGSSRFRLVRGSNSSITVYRDRIEGVPYLHGGLFFGDPPAFASIAARDLSSIDRGVNNSKHCIRVKTRSGQAETFLCKDPVACVEAIKTIMR